MVYKNLIDVVEMSPSYFNFIVNNETIFTSETFENECVVNYNDLSVFFYKNGSSDIQILNYFKKCFDTWKLEKANDVYKFFMGLKEEYNPIENYDRRESGGWVDELHKGSKTSNGFKTETSNASKIETSTSLKTETFPTGKETVENYVVGDDNATPLLASKTETTPISKTTTVSNADDNITTVSGSADDNITTVSGSADDNVTLYEDISSTKFDKNVHVFDEYRVHGNIGVLTSSDALLKEWNLRKQNFVEELIFDFIRKHTMYIESWC